MTGTEIEIRRGDAEPGAALLSVSVPAERVQEQETRAARNIARRAKLPGFRPGKAPLAVVRKQYREAIRETVLRDLIRETWEVAREREELRPIGEPHVHNVRFESGQPMTFEIRVDVRPQIELTRLSGFRLARRVAPVSEEMVQAQLEHLREQRAPWMPVVDASPRAGDLVHVTLAPFEGDAPKSSQPFRFVLGESRALPDVEAQILALRPGESADVDVRYPDDFPEEAKRGTSRRVRIELVEVKRQDLAELTDDFAREVGDFDTLEALRQAVREDLARDAEREADAQVRAQLVEQVAQANGVVAARPLVERALSGLAQAYGVGEDQWERFSSELRPVAEAQVRRDLILDRVAELQGLWATKAELEERVREAAERRGVPPAELYARLEKERRLRELERGITEEKVFGYLLSLSTIDEG